MIEETLAPGAVVSEVARRHGLTPQQLFTWRRQARSSVSLAADQGMPSFVPAIVDAVVPAPKPRRHDAKQSRGTNGLSGSIELTIDGVTVRVGRGADAKTITAVLRALKACP